MTTKKFFSNVIIDILFLIACISFTISCILDYSLGVLISAIMNGFAFLILITVQILSLISDKNCYYISYNHEYYLDGKNLFSDLEFINSKTIGFEKRFLKDKLADSKYKIYRIKNKNLNFKIYELKDNLQLLVFSTKDLRETQTWFDYADMKLNNAIFDKLGISDFPYDTGIEKYYSNNKKIVITIIESEGYFITREYIYSIGWTNSIKNACEVMVPHWCINRDGLNCSFNSLQEAREHVLNDINYINNSFNVNANAHYFITERSRIGTAYHEFQTGNKKGVYWDKTSILLDEDTMEDSGLGSFFEKMIPNYDYFGDSVVSKETWIKLIIESKNESKIIQEIITEMTPWAENSISIYDCFTIKGI